MVTGREENPRLLSRGFLFLHVFQVHSRRKLLLELHLISHPLGRRLGGWHTGTIEKAMEYSYIPCTSIYAVYAVRVDRRR